jgi:hypothetical protein
VTELGLGWRSISGAKVIFPRLALSATFVFPMTGTMGDARRESHPGDPVTQVKTRFHNQRPCYQKTDIVS